MLEYLRYKEYNINAKVTCWHLYNIIEKEGENMTKDKMKDKLKKATGN